MASVRYNNCTYHASSEETLLDALLKQGVKFPHSCKIGTCQSCLTKLVEGTVPPEAQKGLKPTLLAKNYFLSCQCKAECDITISLPEQSEVAIPSKIIKLSMLNYNVLQVRLAIDNTAEFKAGQYINLVTPNNIIRSYSIANVPKEYIELHVKLMPQGLMSGWFSQHAAINDSVYIRGPMGDCFYCNPSNNSFPIVLAGTGTGLAPLVGIASDAIESGHNGKIILIHGGVSESDLYLHENLTQLHNDHSNFEYIPCVLNESAAPIVKSSIDSILIQQLEAVKNNVRLYICGPEETTMKLKTKAFLSGVPSASIYSDSFISTEK